MSKIYIVMQGHKPGIYQDWSSCKQQVDGFSNSKYKSFKNEKEVLENNEYSVFYKEINGLPQSKKVVVDKIVTKNSKIIYVDGACSGNPGPGEYRGVYEDGIEVFHSPIFQNTSNNIMEFLALVEALEFNLQHDDTYEIYSDSQTAISWVKNSKVKTSIKQNELNNDSFALIENAVQKLKNSIFDLSKINKWNTKSQGEIPADFGRK